MFLRSPEVSLASFRFRPCWYDVVKRQKVDMTNRTASTLATDSAFAIMTEHDSLYTHDVALVVAASRSEIFFSISSLVILVHFHILTNLRSII